MSRVVVPSSAVTETGISPGVRHDLQHVLSTLQAVLTVAGSADETQSAEVRELLRTARGEAVHALAVLDSAPSAPEPAVVSRSAGGTATDVDGVLRAAARSAAGTGRTVGVRSHPSLLVPVAHTALTRVVRNLLTNALAASGPAGTVELRAELVPSAEQPPGLPALVRLEVHDDGPGFPAGGAHRSGGRGLGIVRSLVLPAGGWLVLGRSPLGGGCAAVTLPEYDRGVEA